MHEYSVIDFSRLIFWSAKTNLFLASSSPNIQTTKVFSQTPSLWQILDYILMLPVQQTENFLRGFVRLSLNPSVCFRPLITVLWFSSVSHVSKCKYFGKVSLKVCANLFNNNKNDISYLSVIINLFTK